MHASQAIHYERRVNKIQVIDVPCPSTLKFCCINSNEQWFTMMINTFVFASVFLIHFIFT
jgi:hypothetical protein